MSTGIPITDEIEYPDSDGEPMSDNTLQWDWMVKIVSELRVMFAGQQVFVAGDLLWYPVKGDPKTRIGPDGLVAFGRPPGYRGSYKQWEGNDIAPHVVFEVLSPKNTPEEMHRKRKFYERFGVEEFYIIDPYLSTVEGYVRQQNALVRIEVINGYVSPRLGIKFVTTREGLIILTPDGREFQTGEELVSELNTEIDRIHAEQQRMRDQNIAIRDLLDTERSAKEKLMAKLRELGVDPDELLKPTE
jgi:hypothetical protein